MPELNGSKMGEDGGKAKEQSLFKLVKSTLAAANGVPPSSPMAFFSDASSSALR